MNIYNILLIILFLVVIVGIIKGYGENKTIIIFKDYDDLGLTFLVPVSGVLITYLFIIFGGDLNIGIVLGGSVSLLLLIKLIRNTYFFNSKRLFKTTLALVTKLPLAAIWVLNLIEAINPSGKGIQRSRSRGQALLVLTLLTPIIGMLVDEKTGSYFNPRSWIRGHRVGSVVRDNL